MNVRWNPTTQAILLLFFLDVAGHADSLQPLIKDTWNDGLAVYTSPVRLDRNDIPMAAAVTAALGGSLALDRITRQNLLAYSSTGAAHSLLTYGNYAQFVGPMLTGILGASGWAMKDDFQMHVAWKLLESFLWANAVSETFKLTLGRQRPYATADPFELRPGSTSGSFPSGHTISAFAAAATLSDYYPNWKVAVPSYAAASAVAFSRIYNNQHWGSDVVGGALMGIGVSHVLWKRDVRTTQTAWDVELRPDGIVMTKRF